METRKIQFTGRSTYLVSLPKAWVRARKLKVGDLVYISENPDGTLSLSASGQRQEPQVVATLEIEGLSPEMIERRIIAQYIRGFDVLNIRSSGRITTEERKVVGDIMQRIIGPEVIEETAEHIVIQDLLDMTDLSPKNVLRRMYLMGASMFINAMEAVKDGDEELARSVIGRDVDVDRLYLLLCRQLTESARQPGGIKRRVPPETGLQYLLVAKSFERIADHSTRMAEVALMGGSPLRGSLMADITSLSHETFECLEKASEAFFALKEDTANYVLDYRKKIRMNSQRLFSGAREPSPRAYRVFSIMDSLLRIAGYSADIAEAAINLAGRWED
jgi:phosphate uptake regulator